MYLLNRFLENESRIRSIMFRMNKNQPPCARFQGLKLKKQHKRISTFRFSSDSDSDSNSNPIKKDFAQLSVRSTI